MHHKAGVSALAAGLTLSLSSLAVMVRLMGLLLSTLSMQRMLEAVEKIDRLRDRAYGEMLTFAESGLDQFYDAAPIQFSGLLCSLLCGCHLGLAYAKRRVVSSVVSRKS